MVCRKRAKILFHRLLKRSIFAKFELKQNHLFDNQKLNSWNLMSFWYWLCLTTTTISLKEGHKLWFFHNHNTYNNNSIRLRSNNQTSWILMFLWYWLCLITTKKRSPIMSFPQQQQLQQQKQQHLYEKQQSDRLNRSLELFDAFLHWKFSTQRRRTIYQKKGVWEGNSKKRVEGENDIFQGRRVQNTF